VHKHRTTWYIDKHTISLLKAVGEIVSVVPVACWALHVALQANIQKMLEGGNKNNNMIYTMKYNLKQNHQSFQEDVIIDGNAFFKG